MSEKNQMFYLACDEKDNKFSGPRTHPLNGSSGDYCGSSEIQFKGASMF